MKKMALVIGIVIFLMATAVFSQSTWSRSYTANGYGFGYSVVQTRDSGFAVCGEITYTNEPGNDGGDGFVLKTNSSGNVSWLTRAFTDSNFNLQRLFRIKQTTDGGYISCGYSLVNDSVSGAWLVKFNSNGDTLWSRLFLTGAPHDTGYFVFNDIQQLINGSYIITGIHSAPTYGTVLVNCDSGGNEIWRRSYGNLNTNEGLRVKALPGGGYLLLGSLLNCQTWNYYGSILIKTNSVGDTLWTRRLFCENNYYSSMCITNDGGTILTTGTNTDSIIRLVKVNTTGDTLWTRTYNDGHVYITGGIVTAQDSGFVISGTIENPIGSNSYDGAMIKFNAMGNYQWQRIYHYGPADDWLFEIQNTFDNGYVVTGCTYTAGNTIANIWLLKTDQNGDNTTSVVLKKFVLPDEYKLSNYPNPFNSTTIISFSLPKNDKVNLAVYDVMGRKVATLTNVSYQAGIHTVDFNATGLATGEYFIRMQSGASIQTRKITYMK